MMLQRFTVSSTQYGRSFRFFQKSLFSSLSERHVEVVRKHLLNLHSAMCRLKDGRDEATTKRAILSLDELFLLCVVGEFNSGKSSLINRLVGEDVVRVGPTPTTDRIHALTSSPNATSPSFLQSEIDTIGLNSNSMSWLSRGFIIDSPGTNAIVKGHQEISENLIPRADLILFTTSADRPFTESERSFLNLIQTWRKQIVIVVNKVDLLKDESERNEVRDFVRHVRVLSSFTYSCQLYHSLTESLEHNRYVTLHERRWVRTSPIIWYLLCKSTFRHLTNSNSSKNLFKIQ